MSTFTQFVASRPALALSVTSATSGAWTCPAGVYLIWLEVQASGGGGDASSASAGGGGGGGAYKGWLSVTPGGSYSYSLGPGGTSGVNPTNGGNAVFGTIIAYGGKQGADAAGGDGGGCGAAIGGLGGVNASGADGDSEFPCFGGGGGADGGVISYVGGASGAFLGGTTTNTGRAPGGASPSGIGSWYDSTERAGGPGAGAIGGQTVLHGQIGFIKVYY